MLESLGIGEATTPDEADVVVFNTCTIREKPDQRLAAYLGQAAARKRENPELVIAVGGCYAEAQRERIFERYPFVDVAFGPGSIPHLADWIGAGGEAPRGTVRAPRPLRGGAADAPGATVQRLGAGLDGLQLEVRVLHRPGGSRARAEPAAGRDRRGGDASWRGTACARSRCSARTSTRGGAISPRTSAPSSASSCAHATPSKGSSGSASRARTRRTSASR